MIRRSTFALCVVVVVLFLSSCRNEDHSIPPVQQEDRIIQTATLTDDPSQLRVTWDPVECETFDAVEVELDDEFANLRIRVTVDVESCPPGGFNQTVVDLGAPLGDREIWDRAFGDTVALTE
jgi:hypothetical protein